MKKILVLIAVVIIGVDQLQAGGIVIPGTSKTITVNCAGKDAMPTPGNVTQFLSGLDNKITSIISPLPANAKNDPGVQEPILGYAAVVWCLQSNNACTSNRMCNTLLGQVLQSTQNTLPQVLATGTPAYKAPQSVTVNTNALPTFATKQIQLASVAAATQPVASKTRKHKKTAQPAPEPAGNVTSLVTPNGVTLNR